MTQPSLLSLAREFREAAVSAGRSDVVAKIDETILLIADPDRAVGRQEDKADLAVRILNGLGF